MTQFDPVTLVLGLAALTLLPFIAVMISSYVKIVVVLQLVRNALGVQQVPPNMVMNGMAIILSLFVMAPTFSEVAGAIDMDQLRSGNDFTRTAEAVGEAGKPIGRFLKKHADPRARLLFKRAAIRLWPKPMAEGLADDSVFVLVPAFMLTELTRAFQIGFLIFLPFVVIDLVISNILLAMGMMMVSPMTVSLPFKLLLFVVLDGWTRVIEGLILSYQ